MTDTNMRSFHFQLHASDGLARRGTIMTQRGAIQTPAFMPVGTAGTVKAMFTPQVRDIGADILLGNTYHLMLRPGAEEIAKLGGLHNFMQWPHPILTDSGGFQVMSLAKLRKLSEEGVEFQSHLDGRKFMLTPERSIEIQCLLGADIQMQFDECIKLPNTHDEIRRAMELSLRWAERSRDAFNVRQHQALFGIVQGGDDVGLRAESANALVRMDFDGYAIGGLAVGEPQEIMMRMLEVTIPHLPHDKPHYLMGVGTPDDLLKAIGLGVDMFDCVMPTRAGRHGHVYTRYGIINLRNARHKDDPRPLDERGACEEAHMYSRAYLHHLIKSKEYLGAMLLTKINLAYYQQLMKQCRDAIEAGGYKDFVAEVSAGWQKGDIAPIAH